MAVKTPVLLPSCTLTSSGAVQVNISGPSTATLTIPAGRYWTYPSDTVIKASDSIDAIGRFGYLWDTADGGAAQNPVAEPFSPNILGVTASHYANRVEDGDGVLAANASTTDIGRRFLSYMGWAKLTDTSGQYAQGVRAAWSVLPESGSTDEVLDGFGAVVRLGGGAVFTGDLGEPLRRRVVTLAGVPGGYVNQRMGFADNDGQDVSDHSFEHLVWRWGALGEMIRYYADRNATNAYLASAMTATDTSCTLNSGTGFSAGGHVCVDGEWMGITNVAGAVLTVTRHAPVAHSKYAPASTDFVGTYVLAMDGGNINMRQFAPSRRAVNQDRWDMEIALVRTSWS